MTTGIDNPLNYIRIADPAKSKGGKTYAVPMESGLELGGMEEIMFNSIRMRDFQVLFERLITTGREVLRLCWSSGIPRPWAGFLSGPTQAIMKIPCQHQRRHT